MEHALFSRPITPRGEHAESPSGTTSATLWGALLPILESHPGAARLLLEWWEQAHPYICDLEERYFCATLGLAGSAGSTPERPGTSASAHGARVLEMERMMTIGLERESLTDTTEALVNLPPKWCLDLLRLKRTRVGPAGCWFCDLTPVNSRGHCKLDLRQWPHPGLLGQEIGRNIYIHQLALVAAGRANDLRAASRVKGNNLNCSHLCNQGGCFNPEHVLVERTFDNNSRHPCIGKSRIRVVGEDGVKTIYDPCPHRITTSQRVACILPVRTLEAGAYHMFLSTGEHNVKGSLEQEQAAWLLREAEEQGSGQT